jgi:anaerobic magnesium-protoporphyrin IX monomethyl ester cyclase
MRVMVAYPPLVGKGSPMLTQNRQFQWMLEPSYLYPCVPASAATLLRHEGHEVCWVDCIAEHKDRSGFEKLVSDFRPDILAMETKTPVVRQHQAIADRLKTLVPGLQVVLMGDHAAARPEEILSNSRVDWCMTGGDYDYSLSSLVRHLSNGMPLGGGFWWRQPDGAIASSGPYTQEGDLDALPWIDRDLTKAHLYFEKWKKREPFMWTMAGRDCPWAKCTFCSWTVTYPKFRVRSPENLADEMEMLVARYGAREIFDDTGSLPGGAWLDRLCHEMIERKLHEKILFDCNFRFDAFTPENCALMAEAGFRKLILGVESASDRTLDILHKGLDQKRIVEASRWAARAGLQIQLTFMVGYPWETREDAHETLRLARFLMREGLAHHLQATVLVPYPGTPIFDLCERNGWLRFGADAYERFDMTEPVCKLAEMSEEETVRMVGRFYKIFLHPRVLAHQLANLRNLEDLDYLWRGVPAIWGHIRDFAHIRGTADITTGEGRL